MASFWLPKVDVIGAGDKAEDGELWVPVKVFDGTGRAVRELTEDGDKS